MNEKTMQAVLWTGPDQLELDEVQRATATAGESLVRVELTGLCGTDFSILHGTHPRAAAPLVMGHEIIGRVCTSERDDLIGRRVAVLPLISCGDCEPCLGGHAHVCERLGLYGIDEPGGLAEYAGFPTERLFPLDENVPLRAAALVEPLAVAVHAVRRSGLTGGESVAVFGAGPIGILTALVARHYGAGFVVIVEPSEARRTVARELGFTVIAASDESSSEVRAALPGGARIVFDTAAHPSVAAQLPRAVAVRGTVVLVGVYKSPTELDLQTVTFAELSLIGVRVYTTEDFRDAVRLIEGGALGLERLPVASFPLEETEAAFAEALSAGAALKVVVTAGRDALAEVRR